MKRMFNEKFEYVKNKITFHKVGIWLCLAALAPIRLEKLKKGFKYSKARFLLFKLNIGKTKLDTINYKE